jgi:hypothetical protein
MAIPRMLTAIVESNWNPVENNFLNLKLILDLNRKRNKFIFQFLYEFLWEIENLLQKIHRHLECNGSNSLVESTKSTFFFLYVQFLWIAHLEFL